MVLVKEQPVIEQFYTLGEIYFKYQCIGSELRDLLDQITKESEILVFDDTKNDFQNFKKLYQNLISVILDYNEKYPVNAYYNEFRKKFNELKDLHCFLDDLVFLIYKLTPFVVDIIKKTEVDACRI
ncbi:MAG: hypothetical protein ACFFFH_14335 [Candidatus Thorarchaeota archaeon]